VSDVLNIADGLETLLLPMEKIFWTSHFLSMRHDFINLVMSATAKTAAFGQLLSYMTSRIHHYMIGRMAYGAPYHEIG
jgi:hypothetical protein